MKMKEEQNTLEILDIDRETDWKLFYPKKIRLGLLVLSSLLGFWVIAFIISGVYPVAAFLIIFCSILMFNTHYISISKNFICVKNYFGLYNIKFIPNNICVYNINDITEVVFLRYISRNKIYKIKFKISNFKEVEFSMPQKKFWLPLYEELQNKGIPIRNENPDFKIHN